MDYKWEQFGDEIKQSVQDAVERGDFSRLNQTVNDSVSRAADAISRGMKNGGWYRDSKANGGRNPDPKMNSGRNPDPGMAGSRNRADAPWNRGGQQNVRPQYPAQSQVRYLKGTSEKIGGVFLAVTGGVFGTVTLAATIIMLVMLAVTTAEAATIAGTLICVFFFLIFAGMFGKGIGMVSLVSRFRSYVKVIGEREFCDLGELATRTGRDLKKILKDVKKMIGKGWFRQGHLDENEKCLIVSEDAWNQYRSTMENIHRQQAEKEAAEERMRQEYDSLTPEIKKVIQTGDEFVKQIREANKAIPGEEISAKISHMEMLVDKIFDRVEQNPASVGDIRKLMEYYLPTTIKLLQAYQDLDAQPVQGENIISSKKEIEKTLDTLNRAFEKLLDDLFQETAWDVSTDISVLHTMLAQEGLTEDGLKK